MIDAGFFKEEDGFRVIISGHANYAPEGEDIVCSAVSALFYALAGYLATVKGSKCRICRVEKGYAELCCSHAGEEAVRMACIGILQVSEKYPQCVTLYNKIWKSRFGAHSAMTVTPSCKSGECKGVCIHGRNNIFKRIRAEFGYHRRRC